MCPELTVSPVASATAMDRSGVAGTDVAVGGMAVGVAGTGVAVGGMDVEVAGTGVATGVDPSSLSPPQATATTIAKATISINTNRLCIFSFSPIDT